MTVSPTNQKPALRKGDGLTTLEIEPVFEQAEIKTLLVEEIKNVKKMVKNLESE